MFRPAEVRARFPIEKYFKEGRRRELRLSPVVAI
jgi:hypothetical protein